MLIYLLYLVFCLLIGHLGKHKKFGFWGYFFCSLLLTPLIGALLVFSADDLRKRDEIIAELERATAKLKKREKVEAELKDMSVRLGQMPIVEMKLENLTSQLHQLAMKLEEMKPRPEETK